MAGVIALISLRAASGMQQRRRLSDSGMMVMEVTTVLRNLTIVSALGFFLPAIWAAYGLGLGLGGIWFGLTLFVVARLVGLLLRLRSGRWAVVGAVR